jgi:hypothetical protein
MRSRMRIEKPGEVDVTLTVTMSADRWEQIRDWLRESKDLHYTPVKQFANAIDDLLGQTRKLLWHDESEPS